MKGFKDTTKMKIGHHFGPASREIGGKATGGIIAPMGSGSMEPRMGIVGTRPIMPRPRVMPNIKMASIKSPSASGHMPMTRMPSTRFAHGGVVEDKSRTAPRDGGGGPYLGPSEGYGSATEKRGGKHSYSSSQREYPDNAKLRPGYKKGGMKINPKNRGKFTRVMGKKPGHLTDSDVHRGLKSKSGTVRKEVNFARMARRHFKPLARGGEACDPPGTAKNEVNRHVATAPPRGHGIKSGNLAFMKQPLFGK